MCVESWWVLLQWNSKLVLLEKYIAITLNSFCYYYFVEVVGKGFDILLLLVPFPVDIVVVESEEVEELQRNWMQVGYKKGQFVGMLESIEDMHWVVDRPGDKLLVLTEGNELDALA